MILCIWGWHHFVRGDFLGWVLDICANSGVEQLFLGFNKSDNEVVIQEQVLHLEKDIGSVAVCWRELPWPQHMNKWPEKPVLESILHQKRPKALVPLLCDKLRKGRGENFFLFVLLPKTNQVELDAGSAWEAWEH